MAVNHDQKVEVVRRNIAFIQQSIAAGGLATVAGYLLQFELITRQNHDDALAPCGRGPSDQAAMLMRTVELKIRSNPDLYFPRFTQALRWSNLGNVADLLEQQALPDHQRVPGRPAYTPYNTMPNMTPPPGSTHTALIDNPLSSFTNQPSSRYPIPRVPANTSYNPSPSYLSPTQQQQPSYPQTYSSPYPQAYPSSYPHTSQHYTVQAHEHEQSYYHQHNTNTSHMYQNPSPCYQHPLVAYTGYCSPPPQRPRLDYEHNNSFSPAMRLTSRLSQRPSASPTPMFSPRYHPSSMAASFSRISFTRRVSQNCHLPPTPPLAPPPPPPPFPPPPLPPCPQLPRIYCDPSSLYHSLDSECSLLTTFNLTSTVETCTSHAPPTPAPTNRSGHLIQPSSMTASSDISPSAASPSPQHPPYNLGHGSLCHSSLTCAPSSLFTITRPTSTTTAVHSPATPSPVATTFSVVTSCQHSLSPYLQQYVQHLKNRYISIDTPVYDKEQGLLQAKVKSFINIALVHKDSPKYMIDSDKNEMLMDRLHGHVDAIQKKKTKLRMCNVCKSQDGRLARSVLVEGAPGVGKTTFAFEICKRWARGEILQEWLVVVIIKLRDHSTRTAQNMYDILYHPDTEMRQAVVKELVFRQDGKGMLLILDGYDELTDSQRDFNSVIQCLMSRRLLCQSTLMVTSRPLATRTLHNSFVQSIDQHIEVLGFTEKNIEEYIQSACGDKPELVEDFKSYLSSHPFSSALMFNPLQCAIVTDLYRSHWERGDKGFAPKTLTELYTGLVHILLLRYLTQHPVYKDKVLKIEDFSDLPEEVSQQLKAIIELAAEGIENQQYVFDKQADKVPSKSLGLMQAEEEVISGTGTSESYNFLHLTLQEYLAAVNYSQQCSSPEKLSQLLTLDGLFPLNNFLENYGKKRKKHTSSSSTTHWPVVLFVAGRTKLDGISPNILMAGVGHYPRQERKKYRQYRHNPKDFENHTDYSEVNVSLLHLLFETQSPQRIQSTLVTSRKYLSVSGHSALDWFVIGYCIANSTSTWRVEKKSNDSPKYFDQLVMGLRLGPEECIGEYKIGSLHISGHWTGNWKILSQLQPYSKSVTEIKLVGHKQTVQHNSETSKRKEVVEEVSACYPMLEKLTIENAESGFSTLVCFISQPNNLHTLSLKGCNLSNESISSLIHHLQSVDNSLLELILDECIPDHTHTMSGSTFLQLKLLDNGKVSCEITGSCCDISHWLSKFSSYTHITESILHLRGQDTLQEILYCQPVLESLKIYMYSEDRTHTPLSIPWLFTPLSIPWLFKSLQSNLHTLSLSECTLSSNVTRSLIDSMQSPHCRLQNLALKNCTISLPEDTQPTTTVMKTNVVLHSLDTSWSVLNQMMSCINPFTQSLTKLILQVDNDTYTYTSGVETILQEIPSNCPMLETLKIECFVQISLPLSIPQFIGSQQNNLNTLSLMKCNLSSDVTRSLIHSLQSPHCKLYKLALRSCTIPTADHTQLTTAIVNNTTITHLLLIDGNIDTLLLASDLKHNTTIEQLAVETLPYISTKDQFQVLIDAVDSSAVRKLWLLNDHTYKKWFSECTLSRKNIDIEWYSTMVDLFNKF